MALQAHSYSASQRIAEKERLRAVDERALRRGEKSLAQMKRENESFAFPPSRARIDLAAARSLV